MAWTAGQLVAFTPENSGTSGAKIIHHVLPSGRAVVKRLGVDLVFDAEGFQIGGMKRQKHLRGRIREVSAYDRDTWEKASAYRLQELVKNHPGVDPAALRAQLDAAIDLYHRKD